MKLFKLLTVFTCVLTLLFQTVQFVQALRFARGGANNTFFSIAACTDGFAMNIGLDVGNHIGKPNGTILTATHVRPDGTGDVLILDETDFMIDGPPATVMDTETGQPVTLTHTTVVQAAWTTAPLSPGSRIRINGITLRDPGTGVADYFEATVQPCTLANLPPDRDARVFYVPGFNTQNPGSNTPDTPLISGTVVTSTITVGADAFPGQIITDLDVGVYLRGTGVANAQVYAISPAGTRVKLFSDVDSSRLGTKEIDLQNAEGPDLVRNPMPNFVLDDESTFTFATSPAPFITEAIQPASALSQFDGEDPAGEWILEVHAAKRPICSTYTISPNATIPDGDGNGRTFLINVPDNFVITDMDIGISILHENVGDLDALLYDPQFVLAAQLFNRVGGSGDNFNGTWFDDEADRSIAEGTPPFSGSYRPATPLSNFDGSSSLGDWQLLVRDNAAGTVGQIQSADLLLCGLRTGEDAGILDTWALEIEVGPAEVKVFLPQALRP